jgi:site-specific recombinase XerD
MATASFQSLLSGFFNRHLRSRGGMSENTVRTYSDAFVCLLRYMRDVRGKWPDDVTLGDLDSGTIESFLDWLETDLGVSVSTRNNRLFAIRSFFRYVSTVEPSALEQCSAVLEIGDKSGAQRMVSYLSQEAVRLLMSLPDASDRKQLRAKAIIVLLYDSGARVSELRGANRSDLRLGPAPTLTLHGKGGKPRIVPVDPSVAKLVERYAREYGVGPDEPLFFNSRRERLTREGISYILKSWFARAKELRPEIFPEKISPHCMRHSKAMHMLEDGVELIYIRDILGHASVTTTEIYAKTNPEVKRRPIEKAGEKIVGGEKPDFGEEKRQSILDWLKSGARPRKGVMRSDPPADGPVGAAKRGTSHKEALLI